METHPSQELPIRAKVEMLKDIQDILHCLHSGHTSAADLAIEDLKTRAVFFDEQVQQNVLMFAEQVQFQARYDLRHNITHDIQKAADRLIESLGFQI